MSGKREGFSHNLNGIIAARRAVQRLVLITVPLVLAEVAKADLTAAGGIEMAPAPIECGHVVGSGVLVLGALISS